MTLSLERWLIRAKEALSPYEVRLTSLETNPVFQCLGDIFLLIKCKSFNSTRIFKSLEIFNISQLRPLEF